MSNSTKKVVSESLPIIKLKIVKNKVDINDILKEQGIEIPKNWLMSDGTANWNMKSKAMTLVKRMYLSETLSEKVIALEQYKKSYDSFLESKTGSKETIEFEAIQKVFSFMKLVAIKNGVTEGTLDNLLDHFAPTSN